MNSTKKILLAAFAGVVIIYGIVSYWNWSERNSRGAPPPAFKCRIQLREIDGAKQQWALLNGKTTNDIPTWDDIRPYLGRNTNVEILVCPSGGTYTLGRVGEPALCSDPGHTSN